VPSHFPPGGRRFTLGPVLPGSRDNSWDTGDTAWAGECDGQPHRLGYSLIEVSTAVRGLVMLTAPYPVDRWTIYTAQLKPAPNQKVNLPQPPRVFVEAFVGCDYATDPVALFQWDALAFNEGQFFGLVAGRPSTTLQLWGRVDGTLPVFGPVQVNFRVIADRGGFSGTTPVVQRGPNVT